MMESRGVCGSIVCKFWPLLLPRRWLQRIGGCGICGSSSGANRDRNHGVPRRAAKFFAPEIKTPTMLDTAGPSPNGVLLTGFKSRVQCWIRGASQPALVQLVLCYSPPWHRWRRTLSHCHPSTRSRSWHGCRMSVQPSKARCLV